MKPAFLSPFTMVLAIVLATVLAVTNDNKVVMAFSSFTGTSLSTSTAINNRGTLFMEYIPSGLSKEQWKKLKEDEKKKTQGKNLGVVGITSFKSRSFADWQKSGGKNLFPVDPKTVKNVKDIPYMQRPGGSADDDDIKKKNPFLSFAAKKKKEVPKPEPPKTNWWTL